MENTVDKKSLFRTAKKDYMIIFAYLIAMIIGSSVLQLIAGAVFGAIGIAEKPYAQYLLILIPLHLITMPVAYFLLRVKRDTEIEKKSISPLLFLGIIPIIYAGVYAGNSISNIITSLINDQSQQAVANLTASADSDFFRILVVGISAPIVEEILFRKLIIDRLAKYSQIWAVIISSVSFGIFHMNLAQLFYATIIGFILGYVYIKTGKLIYTIALHMVVNLATSAIAANLLKLNSDTPIVIYSAVLLILAVLGVVLFIVKYRKFMKLKKNENITSGQAAKLCLLNPVSIIYFVIGFGSIAFTTIAMIAMAA